MEPLSIHYGVHGSIIFFIVILYFIIAYQFKSLINSDGNRQAKRALLYLVGIFILCAISGYLPAIIYIPEMLSLISHIALIISSILFITTNQARNIYNALK